jgi:hypothetical protein
MTRDCTTVCVLAAGHGSRLEAVTGCAHKALAPVGYRAVLSRLIGQFPAGTRFVVAVGHRAEYIREYLSVVHPDIDVQFVDVPNYDGPASGPGLSLLACRPHLPGPFVLTACDTLVEEPVPPPVRNWIGVAPHPRVEDYCSVGVNGSGHITRINYRQRVAGNVAFIGIAGVADAAEFWRALDGNRSLIHGEHQLGNGLAGLIQHRLEAQPFTWHDTGDEMGLRAADRRWRGDFSNLDKANEFIYFENGSVVKFFSDAEIVRKRVARNRVLGTACPPITAASEHFYSYPFVEGDSLSERVDDGSFGRFLEWCDANVWRPRRLTAAERVDFESRCHAFYADKTQTRMAQFFEKTGVDDSRLRINSYDVEPAAALLNRIDWDALSQGVAVGFHGDLHFHNTIVPFDAGQGPFKLVDWRQEFCGLIEYGDWYYDLAKIHHELIISHEQIKAGQFNVEESDGSVRITHLTRSEYVSCQKVLARFAAARGLDYRRILVLTYLIFLNMAPLHHAPFDRFLYYLGRLGLHELLVAGYADRHPHAVLHA